MFTTQKNLLLVLALCTAFGLKAKAKAFPKDSAEMTTTIVTQTKKAFKASMQAADHLFYPAICLVVGRHVYKNHISDRLAPAPDKVTEVEKTLPGGDLARRVGAYVVVGGILALIANAATNNERVSDFMHTNMPHITGLIDQVKNDLSSSTKEENIKSTTQNDILICRGCAA